MHLRSAPVLLPERAYCPASSTEELSGKPKVAAFGPDHQSERSITVKATSTFAESVMPSASNWPLLTAY